MELFKITVSQTVCVVGEDAADALQRAQADLHNMLDGMEFSEPQPLQGELLPPGWDGTMIPFGDESGVCIRDLCKGGV